MPGQPQPDSQQNAGVRGQDYRQNQSAQLAND